MQDLISSILSILGVKEGDVGEDDDLTQLGIDSMQVVEVRATLQKSLGRAIPLDEVRIGSHAVESFILPWLKKAIKRYLL